MPSGTLYVVATPLGNLGDLSYRAAEVLQQVGLVAAEDTRRSRKLLHHVGAHPRVVSFHAHSKEARLETLVEALTGGQSVALLTDAGTPTVSDPGASLVEAARSAGVPVVPVPGPSAVATALSVSGLPANRYTFLGFVPRSGADRRRLLAMAAASPWTVVLFEGSSRLGRLLRDLAVACGADRRAVVAREMTKMHEEIRPGTLAELADCYAEESPLGEVTVIVAGAPAREETMDVELVRARAREMLREGCSRRDAAARLASELNVPRRDAYRVVSSL